MNFKFFLFCDLIPILNIFVLDFSYLNKENDQKQN